MILIIYYKQLKSLTLNDVIKKKIYELMGHIYGIYYTKLYKHIEQQNPAVLFYMFNEQGLIAPENRTKALPKPAL